MWHEPCINMKTAPYMFAKSSALTWKEPCIHMKRALYTYEKNPVYKYKEPCILAKRAPLYLSRAVRIGNRHNLNHRVVDSSRHDPHAYVQMWKEPCIHMKRAVYTCENSSMYIWKQPCTYMKRAMQYLFGAVDADNSGGLNDRVVDPSYHDPRIHDPHVCGKRPIFTWKEPCGHTKTALPYTSSGPLTLTTVTVLIIESSIPPTMTHMPAEAVEIGMRYRPWYSLRYGRNIYAQYVKRDLQIWKETYWPACLSRRRRWECDTALGTDCSKLKVCETYSYGKRWECATALGVACSM